MNPLNVVKFVPLSAMRAVALFVAPLTNHLPNVSIKRNIDTNLRLAYPELDNQERQQFSAKVIRNQFLSAVESIKCWAMAPEWSVEQVNTVHNQEVLEKALENPNGLLVIVPHLGTWEIMNAWFNQFDSPTIMYKPVENKWQNNFILKGRQKLKATLVPTDAVGVKAIFKTLKSGGSSIVLPDHVPNRSSGVNAPFFGVDTLTSTLAPKLASKTKCSMVGLVCLRSDNAHPLNSGFDIHCIALDDPELFDKDITVATTALNKAIENMVREHPTHYMWGYRRFKNHPLLRNPYKANAEQLKAFIASVVANKQATPA